MTSAKVSEKFQVVIPKDVRETLGIKPKQELMVWAEGDTVRMAKIKKVKDPIAALKKFSKQYKTELSADEIDRLIEEGIEHKA